MRARTSTGHFYALLTDGTQVEIRPLTGADREAVCALHRGLSDESLYLRFFGLNRAMADRIADQVCRPDGPGHGALGAWLRGELIGIAEYEPSDAPGEAEVARSEEHTSELQSRRDLVCRLLLEKKKRIEMPHCESYRSQAHSHVKRV